MTIRVAETPENGFDVHVTEEESVWWVTIVDPSGADVSRRVCRNGAEARIYASTVRQHIYWLSPEAFRAYYRIEG
jgi:hypothetical protein